jgi:fatty acid desaturase
VGCILIGYTLAYINLFFHEAAHYLVAPRRDWNDWLANLFIGVLFGQDIRSYRIIHFDHHRHLGTPKDTERTYFDALSLRFFLELLTGIKALKVLRERNRYLKKRACKTTSPQRQHQVLGTILAAIALHVGLLLLALAFGLWFSGAAWLLGMGIVFPAFGATRQVLEHRDQPAADVDYRRVPHGALSRLFGDGLLASTFGGAGFNRHLLHHWDPQVSFTRLRDLERFLLDTPLGADLQKRRTSYGKTFLQLVKW